MDSLLAIGGEVVLWKTRDQPGQTHDADYEEDDRSRGQPAQEDVMFAEEGLERFSKALRCLRKEAPHCASGA